MKNEYTVALSKTFPAPDGIKVVAAGADAPKMLAFWSAKQDVSVRPIRVNGGGAIAKLVRCPHCHADLSARLLKLSASQVALLAAFAPAEDEPAKDEAVEDSAEDKPVDETEPVEDSE